MLLCLLSLCRYVAAMNVPEGGNNDIPNRLKRQFAIFNVPPPSTAAINNIFGALMEGRFDASVFGAVVRSPGFWSLALGLSHHMHSALAAL